jgi:hypothetical protein
LPPAASKKTAHARLAQLSDGSVYLILGSSRTDLSEATVKSAERPRVAAFIGGK